MATPINERSASDPGAQLSPQSDAFPRTSTISSDPPSVVNSPTSSAFQRPPASRISRQRATETSFDTAYLGEVIPPHTTARSLVLCFDGTGDQFDDDNSNIVQFFAMLKKGDKNQQLVYYQAGIGTYTTPQIATPLISKLTRTLDSMFAMNLNHHVMGGYEFLMENYREGDKICIFGFSRGAYTARALAGMVHKVGLLPNCNHQQVPFAYRMFMKDDDEGWKQSILFKRTFSIDVDIEFVGVWDTVASVGIVPKHLPFTKSNTAIKTFRHAISLDEHRAKFKANYYHKTTKREADRGDFAIPGAFKPAVAAASEPGTTKNGSEHERPPHSKLDSKVIFEDLVHAARHGVEAVKRTGSSIRSASNEKGKNGSSNGKEHDRHDDELRKQRLEEMYTDRSKPTDALEVFFAGCHCDVGGGSVSNDTRHSLARIPLRWMIRQCFLTNTGIQFEADKLRDIAGIDPASLWPTVHPRPPPLPIPNPAPITPMHTLKKKAKKAPPIVQPVQEDVGGDKPERSSIDKSIVHAEDATTSAAAEVDLSSDPGAHARISGVLGHFPFQSEEDEELRDSLCPVYDQLKLSPPWWVLEFFPIRQRVQRDDGTWKKVLELNLARPRVYPRQEKHRIKVHRSVKMRMDAKELAYQPRLRFNAEPEWVD